MENVGFQSAKTVYQNMKSKKTEKLESKSKSRVRKQLSTESSEELDISTDKQINLPKDETENKPKKQPKKGVRKSENSDGANEESNSIKKQKNEKTDGEEKIEGDFQIEGLNWFSNKEDGKKLMRIDANIIPHSINQKCFSFIHQKEKTRICTNVHYEIKEYFSSGNEIYHSLFSQEEKEFLMYQFNIVQQYLQKRNMNNFKYDADIKHLDVSKKVDILCENEEECILVSFVLTKRSPKQVVLVDNKFHFLDLLYAAESIYDNKKKVTVLIVPLLILPKFYLIEFNKEEIAKRQIGQENNDYFQKNYIKNIEGDLWKSQQVLLEKCNLTAGLKSSSLQNLTVLQFIQHLLKSKNEEELNYYLDTVNAPERYNPRKIECMKMQFKNEFQQFFTVHTVLISQYKNAFLKYATDLKNKQNSYMYPLNQVFLTNTECHFECD